MELLVSGYHTSLEGACVCMVIVHYKEKNSSEYKRESFLDVQHYMKWRDWMGKRLVDVRPVRKGCVKLCVR